MSVQKATDGYVCHQAQKLRKWRRHARPIKHAPGA